MDEDRLSHFYYIQSADKNSGTSSNFITKNHEFNDTHSYRISEIILPFTFYNINDNNNVLKIRSGVTIYTVTLTNGNYTISQLLAQLKISLDALAVGVWTLTNDPITYKLTIASSIAYEYLGTQSTMNYILGFDDLDLVSALTNTGPYLYNLSNTNYVDIVSRSLSKSSTKVRDTGYKSASTIIRVPCSNYSFGQTILYKPKFHVIEFKPENSNDIDILLLDDRGNSIDLNGFDISITLKFHTNRISDPLSSTRVLPQGFF